MAETARIDRWLWAVRVFKTRALAAKGCTGGHVEVNGRSVKPAHKVVVGDRVEARVGDRVRIVEITTIIEKRVGAAAAVDCYDDHSPPPPERTKFTPQAVRDAGAGRPTKKDRRQLDRYLNRKE